MTAENTSIPKNNAVQNQIIYSYGLFSDDPLSSEMENTIKENYQVTNRNHVVLGYKDVMEDIGKMEGEFQNSPIQNLKKTYELIPRGVSKSDLARLIHLYVRGGHYADLDVNFLKDPSTNSDKVILYTENYAPFPRIANYAISAPPNHPFILAVIKEVVNRTSLLLTRQGSKKWNDDDVLQTTGPDVITDVYRSWKGNDVKRIGLLKSKKILRHKAAGSWRKGKDV